MKKKHEKSIIDAFSSHFLKKGKSLGKNTNRFSLDGQDAILGADYIFTESTKFALVEFKYEEPDLMTEGGKELRHTLCLKLEIEKIRQNQSLQCHYIAWSKKKSERREVFFNRYYPEICNKKIFPKSILSVSSPFTSSRLKADELISQFLEGSIGSSFEVFNDYVNWILKIGDKDGSHVEVMLDNPDSDQLYILEFSSLDLLNSWLIQNQPSPTPSSSPSP